MKLQDLGYVRSPSTWDEQAIEQVADSIEREYKAHADAYDRFEQKRSNVEQSGRNVRLTAFWTVCSIKTNTSYVDGQTDDMVAGNFAVDKQIAVSTTDGAIKWDHIGTWFSSDMPDKVARSLSNGNVEGAIARLAGRNPVTGESLDKTYLRTCKGSLVPYLMGHNRLCIDTRIYNAIKPVLEAITYDMDMRMGDTEMVHAYRNARPNAGTQQVPVVSHSGDPEYEGSKSFLEDKLKWNPVEFHTLGWGIVEILSERSNAPEGVIPQILFNLQGERTFHGDLMDRLE
jgi:hypothetical protein